LGRMVVKLTELTEGQDGIVLRVEGSRSSSSGKRGNVSSRNGQSNENTLGIGSENCMEPVALQSCPEEKCGFVQRLMDLGLTPGAKIAVVKSAPFNGPVEILVRGSRIALGRCVASKIKVEVTG
jgi:Fe2+ transport system protein FeoA